MACFIAILEWNLPTVTLLTTSRTALVVLGPEQYVKLYDYERDNKSHLAPWEPQRTAQYFSKAQTKARVGNNYTHFIAGTALPLVAIDNNTGKVVASCSFSNIIKGPFQACYLGYSVSYSDQGKGYMYEILTSAIDYVFNDLGLHRIMANYIPSNQRSGKLLARLGFEQEGLAKAYLQIAGTWQDHVLTAKIRP